MILFRLCGLALLAAAVCLLLKTVRSPLVPVILGAGLLLVWLPLIDRLSETVSTLTHLMEDSGFSPYGKLMLKALGITLTVRFSADLCRDSGAETLASTLESIGKIEILFLCLPLLTELLSLLKEVMT